MRSFRHFGTITTLFVVVLLISNTVATKFIHLGPFVFTGGILLFPIGYVFGDVLTEVYGFTSARRAIWLGFFSLAFMAASYWLIGALPAAPGWEGQHSYDAILGVVPRLAIASFIGYWVGQFANAFIMARMKVLTRGKHLWTRTIGSTIVGEGIDTVLFALIGFWGTLPNSLLVTAIISGYVFKVAYEALATPLTYGAVAFLKRRES